jgi:hypothetical protein
LPFQNDTLGRAENSPLVYILVVIIEIPQSETDPLYGSYEMGSNVPQFSAYNICAVVETMDKDVMNLRASNICFDVQFG